MRRLVDMIGLPRQDTKRPRVPDTVAVFAIGDIHGEVDLLVRMHRQILQEAAKLPANLRKTIVYLGDYIDHGRDSAGVIDLLVSAPLPGFTSHYLSGNHELSFLNFIKGDLPRHKVNNDHIINWLHSEGGLATLHSYGVDTKQNLVDIRVQLLRKMPTDHFTFLERLQLSHSVGDFFFAHAGVDPRRSLKDQRPMDLLNGGHDFLEHNGTYDKIIVHGHSTTPDPLILHNRIALDTDAHRSGRLSAVMIHHDNVSVIKAQL